MNSSIHSRRKSKMKPLENTGSFPRFKVGDRVRYRHPSGSHETSFIISKITLCLDLGCEALKRETCGGYSIIDDYDSRWCPAGGEFEKVEI
jgi:hypothetical protein